MACKEAADEKITASDYITETLTKLEKQTYPNFEIVIVNDGSKDNTSNVFLY